MTDVRTTERDQIITVTIDREAKRNAVSPEVTEALWDALHALATRDDLRCMVITGTGSYFTAGLDLAAAGEARKAAGFETSIHPGWGYRRYYRGHHQLYDEMEAVEKPIVVAAQGICIGAGVEMALSSDFRFCTPEAEFALPEVAMGVIPGSGGTTRLTRIVGPAWAKYMTMSGSRITAARAQAIGLVHDVFPAATFMDEVYAFCRRMVAHPAESVGVAKLAVDLAADINDRGAQRHMDRLINTNLTRSDSYREALARFAKKPPQ